MKLVARPATSRCDCCSRWRTVADCLTARSGGGFASALDIIMIMSNAHHIYGFNRTQLRFGFAHCSLRANLNTQESLRSKLLFAVMTGKRDISGGGRRRRGDTGKASASSSAQGCLEPPSGDSVDRLLNAHN